MVLTTRYTLKGTRYPISAWHWSEMSVFYLVRMPLSSAMPRSPAVSSMFLMFSIRT